MTEKNGRMKEKNEGIREKKRRNEREKNPKEWEKKIRRNERKTRERKGKENKKRKKSVIKKDYLQKWSYKQMRNILKMKQKKKKKIQSQLRSVKTTLALAILRIDAKNFQEAEVGVNRQELLVHCRGRHNNIGRCSAENPYLKPSPRHKRTKTDTHYRHTDWLTGSVDGGANW